MVIEVPPLSSDMPTPTTLENPPLHPMDISTCLKVSKNPSPVAIELVGLQITPQANQLHLPNTSLTITLHKWAHPHHLATPTPKKPNPPEPTSQSLEQAPINIVLRPSNPKQLSTVSPWLVETKVVDTIL